MAKITDIVEGYEVSDRSEKSSGQYKRFSKTRSKRAELAAEKEIESVLKDGKKMPRKELALAVGASVEKLSHSTFVSESFNKPIETTIVKMRDVREKVLSAMLEKDYGMVSADRLSNILKNLTHDIQLLSGGKTENVHLEEDRDVIKGFMFSMRGNANQTSDTRGTQEG